MNSRYRLLILLVSLLTIVASVPAKAQQPYLGEIRYVAFNFAPQGWALCDGQLLSIAQNTALFDLIGTTFGGDGKTTFALPNMQGRVPVATGSGAGLTPRTIGQQGGQETVALTVAEMPAHKHAIAAASGTAGTKAPAGNVLANSSSAPIYSSQAPDVKLSAKSVGFAGQGQPHENMQPFLAMTCIIALQGVFPTQN